MLSLTRVAAGYLGVDVVHDITFQVQDGESLAIIGPNGCGKTTLLKAIAGILPYSGSIHLDGVDILKLKQQELALGIAMLSQVMGIYFSFTVYETVMMGRYVHIQDKVFGMPSTADAEKVEECLQLLDLQAVRQREITTLSGGQLQRVFLARALAQDPKIILLDEPTNHLDLKFQVELIEHLMAWAAEGQRAVVGVLHDVNLALRLPNLMVMKEGRILAHGKTDEVVNREVLRCAYEIDVAAVMQENLSRWRHLV